MQQDSVTPAELRPGQRINIQNCHSCDARHDEIEVHEFAGSAAAPWTHWFTCPTTGDPVPIALAQQQGKDPLEVNHQIFENVVRAQQTDRYMVACFRMQDGVVHLDRLTVNFPTAEFQASWGLLKQDLEREVGPPEHTPLERASVQPGGLVNLFGSGGNSEGRQN